MVPTEDIPENVKLEEEIAELKSRIKNTEYDLANTFKGNNFLKQKLETSKNMLTNKEARLSEITAPADRKDSLVTPADLSDPAPISEDQKDIIDQEIEEDLV